MTLTSLRDTLDAIKSSVNLADYAHSRFGLRTFHSGSCITAPYQFRPDDNHPSFAVYENGAHDFATGKDYDLFQFIMVMTGCSFKEAVQEFEPDLFTPKHPVLNPEALDTFEKNRAALKANVQKWHDALLANPECTDPITGENIRPLYYLLSRGISQDTIDDLMLGFDAKELRITIPFLQNGVPVYFAGRDVTSRWKSEGSPEQGKKYKYASTDYGIEKIAWGLQSLKKHACRNHSRKALISDLEGNLEEETLREDTLFICEGLLDGAILIQDGWQVLSSGGGNFSRSDKKKVLDLMHYYKRVVLCFDNDNAGHDFARRLAELCLAEHVKFAIADIPHELNGHSGIKDVNDYYLADGSFSELVKAAKPGLVFCAEALETTDEIYEFVKRVKGFASDHDLDQIKEMLVQKKRVEPKGDPGAPDIASEPLFKKGQITSAFKAAFAGMEDKEVIARVLDEHNIVFSQGKFYEFTGKVWEKITDLTAQRYVSKVLGPTAKAGRCSAIMKFMKSELEELRPFDQEHIFVADNGVFLLDETDPEKRFVKHSPHFMNTGIVDYAIDPYGDKKGSDKPEQFQTITPQDLASARIEDAVDCTFAKMHLLDGLNARRQKEAEENLPLHKAFEEAGYTPSIAHEISPWQKFIRSIMVDKQGHYDPALARELQKMAGYIFFPDNRLEACFLLSGRGSNGKSTFLSVMQGVFGRNNCSFLRPDRLSNPFDVMLIKHVWLNICHESAKSMNGAEETLKAVTSGNPVTGSYKGQDAVSFESRAKWIICANSIMDVKDVSYGFLRRMVCIPFNATFKGEAIDPNLKDKLMQNRSEIFWWCYEGYKMLMKGERFITTPMQEEEHLRLRETIDPCFLFVREALIEGSCEMFKQNRGAPYTENEMYHFYREWCQETNNEILSKYVALEHITYALEDRMPFVVKVRLTDAYGRTTKNYFVDTRTPLYTPEEYDAGSQALLRELGAIEDRCSEVEAAPAESVPEPEPASHEDIPPVEIDDVSEPVTPAEVPEPEDKAPAGEVETQTLSPELAELSRKKDEHIALMLEKIKEWAPNQSDYARRGRAIQNFISEYAAQEWYRVLTPEEWIVVSDSAKAHGEPDFLQRLRNGWRKAQEHKKEIPSSDSEEPLTPEQEAKPKDGE